MSQEELIQRVADSAPVTDGWVEALDLERAESELLAAIMDESPVATRPSTRSNWRVRLGRRSFALRAGALLAAGAVAAALIYSGIQPGGDGDGDGGVAYAAEWIRIAEENPRLLVTAPGWEVTRADEYKPDYGNMAFSDGTAELELHWYPVESYHGYFADRAAEAEPTQIELLGRTATLFDPGSGTYSSMFRPGGETFVEISGGVNRRLSREDFLALLDTLQAVDVETWLAALPASVVQPGEREAAVEEMLDGVPVPPGFDLESLAQDATTSDRYHLAAQVTGSVTCAWLERRMSGLQNDDSAKVKEAEDALATARTWPILVEIRDDGGWSEEIWDWAADGRGSSGSGPNSTENPSSLIGCAREAWRGMP